MAPTQDYQDKIEQAVKEILDGLTTDGAHHKQYALEQALLLLTTPAFVQQQRDAYGWEEGIPA